MEKFLLLICIILMFLSIYVWFLYLKLKNNHRNLYNLVLEEKVDKSQDLYSFFCNYLGNLKSENEKKTKQLEHLEILLKDYEKIKENYDILKKSMETYKDEIKNMMNALEEVIKAFKEVMKAIKEETSMKLNLIYSQSEKIKEGLHLGDKNLKYSLNEITGLITDAEDVFQTISMLHNRIYEISGATSIKNIVKSISLISLNAQIEAQRLGKKAEGFILLASEMRKLANDGEGAFRNISKMTDEVINILGVNQIKFNNFFDNIKELQVISEAIKTEFSNMAEMIEEILETQKDVSEQFNQHMNGIEEITGILENIYSSTIQNSDFLSSEI